MKIESKSMKVNTKTMKVGEDVGKTLKINENQSKMLDIRYRNNEHRCKIQENPPRIDDIPSKTNKENNEHLRKSMKSGTKSIQKNGIQTKPKKANEYH